jgi:hypothetical protein
MQKSIDGVKKTPAAKPTNDQYKTKDLLKASLKIFAAILRRTKRNFFKNRIAAVTVVILLVVIVGLLVKNSNSSPIPKSIRKTVNFPLYYPSKLPNGYTYEKSSAKSDAGIVFYSLKSGDKKILVSEQTAPAHPPDLNALTKPQTVPAGPSGFSPPAISLFQKIDNSTGQAIQGTSIAGNPVAIILTDTTLINLSGSATLPSNVITEVVQSLSVL